MIWFIVGFIVGIFSLVCLVLCQAQKNDNPEKIYFAAFNEFDGIKLYLNHDVSWGNFSEDTVLGSTVTDLDNKCNKLNVEMLMIDKIGVRTRFIQTFK